MGSMPEEEMKWIDVAHAQMPNYQYDSGKRGEPMLMMIATR